MQGKLCVLAAGRNRLIEACVALQAAPKGLQPALIGASRSRTQGDDVGGNGLSVTAVRCAGPPAVLFAALQTLFPHQPGATAFARARSPLLQIHQYPRRPIGAPAGLVGRCDLRREGRILALPQARPMLTPAVIAAA